MTNLRLRLLSLAFLCPFVLYSTGSLAQIWGGEPTADVREEDPGSTEDPWTDDSESTLGQDLEPFMGDPIYLDDPAFYSADQIGQDPSYGYSAAAGPVRCTGYTGATVYPVRLSADSPRFLSYNATPRILIGASADAACHFVATAAAPLTDNCLTDLVSPGTNTKDFRTVLPALKAAGLNKIRLWVALGQAKDPVNAPFAQEGGFYILNKKNQPYFDRLVAVVSKAKELGMFVEVTFFAPFEGRFFSSSPWSWDAGKSLAPEANGTLTRAGFTREEFFVVKDTGVEAAKNERMRTYQKKVIEWTIEELWCYDNVFWEIANEPENQKVNPSFVTTWQKDMITEVVLRDQRSLLGRPHLIAVQPFTKTGAASLIADPRVSIVNGHYTQILTDPIPTMPAGTTFLDFGAIQLARKYGNLARALGFNEGKITPYTGTAGPRRHLNGVLDTQSSLDAARAESLEFLFSLGGILDHWGYLSKNNLANPIVGKMRTQLSKMTAFMTGLPLAKLKTSATDTGNPPSWITSGLNQYPTGKASWDAVSSSQRFWAALQTDSSLAAGRLFLLYAHHSTRRCLNDQDFTSAGCPNTRPEDPTYRPYMALGGYDARVWTPASGVRYTANFTVDLGPKVGNFDVTWLRPTDFQPLKQQVLAWRQASCSLANCVACSGPSGCTVSFPEGYDFDIILKISQRP